MIGFILGPDRNSGSGPLRYPFRWNLGWYWFRLGTGRFGRYQTGTAIFFNVVFRLYDELPVSRAPSSSLAGSRALLQFPGCITCSPPVPRLYHVLPSSSQNVSWQNPLTVPDFNGDSGTGSGAKFSSGRVVVYL